MPDSPEFRYLMLINESTTENNDIFPFLKKQNGQIAWDGSSAESTNSVPPSKEGAQSHTYDLTKYEITLGSPTILILGGCTKGSANPASDIQNKWSFNNNSTKTVYGIYHEDRTFTVYPPNPSGNDAAALSDAYHSINSPAVAKFCVALGGLISPEMI